jgi:uncharacterized membrane protein
MAQEMGPAPGGELTDQDKLMAALSYPIPIVAIIILLVEDMKNRPFQKFHAVQSLAINIVDIPIITDFIKGQGWV